MIFLGPNKTEIVFMKFLTPKIVELIFLDSLEAILTSTLGCLIQGGHNNRGVGTPQRN